MEADQGRRLARIEVADDGVANLPVEILQCVGLGAVWMAAAAALA
jgi:hypothetical protein